MLRQRDLHSEQPRTTVPNIIGYDANALYLWALDQSMPTGPYIRRRADTKIRGEVSDVFKSKTSTHRIEKTRPRGWCSHKAMGIQVIPYPSSLIKY
uniref:DNA-directed DNA polymerase n=1 Tax=Magallana gigas TaxID=29159 RepID=A0A8W8MGS7_MAGGI